MTNSTTTFLPCKKFHICSNCSYKNVSDCKLCFVDKTSSQTIIAVAVQHFFWHNLPRQWYCVNNCRNPDRIMSAPQKQCGTVRSWRQGVFLFCYSFFNGKFLSLHVSLLLVLIVTNHPIETLLQHIQFIVSFPTRFPHFRTKIFCSWPCYLYNTL